MKAFLQLWGLAIIRPRRAMTRLLDEPAPAWGLYATLVRFAGTAASSILALALFDRRPFVPSYLTFLQEEGYYRAEVLFLPLFGIAAWLLSGALVHVILRLSRGGGDVDRVLNVIGFSLLVVMPVVWLVDWTAIALDASRQTIVLVSKHSVNVALPSQRYEHFTQHLEHLRDIPLVSLTGVFNALRPDVERFGYILYQAYADRKMFVHHPGDDVELLSAEQLGGLAGLKRACSELEWAHSSLHEGSHNTFGQVSAQQDVQL